MMRLRVCRGAEPTSRIGTIARRTFLIGSAAIVGGVAFGIYEVKKPISNPLTPGAGEATLNPHILINADGGTIIAPRAEMGQGIHSTLAALVAEELDVDWDKVTVLHGPPAQACYNAAMIGQGLPMADYAKTSFQEGPGDQLGAIAKVFSLQVTGGSSSTRDGYDRMRLAGASAREALKLAASASLRIPTSDLRAEKGAVIAPDGTALPYAELAPEAAKIDPPQPELRPKSDWKLLGTALPRKDLPCKSTGTAQFGIDVRLPGMRFATVRMNPARTGMVSFDPTVATTMDGVEQIIDLGTGIAVVAGNTWLAFQAAEAVDITWEPAAYPATTAEMMAAITTSLDDAPNSTLRDDGDAAATIDGGTRVRALYTVPFLAHATMEPMNAKALYTGTALDIWAGNQAPVVLRDKCAVAVGLAADQVTVHTTLMGGGFGRRGETDFAVYAARVAHEMPDTPVQVTWTREEDMRHDFYRPAAVAKFDGVVKVGAAVLLNGRIAAPSVSRSALGRIMGFAPPGADKGLVEGAFDQPYGIPNFRITGHLTDLAVPLGFWRSVGSSINGFMLESFIDEMAHAAGADPLQFRLQLAAREHAPGAAVLEAVARMSNWTGQTPAGIGRGVAFTMSVGTPVAEVVEVVDDNGKIRISKVWIACDVGTALNPDTVQAQMIGGAVYGLSAAVMGKIIFTEGAVDQGSFPDYDALRMHNTPAFEVQELETGPHLTGVGEPGTPPSMPALANALFDLTGRRATQLPLILDFDPAL